MNSEEKISNNENNEEKIEKSSENQTKNDFETELTAQKSSLDAEKFAKQQEEYKTMLASDDDFANSSINNDPFAWRVGFGRRLGAYLIDQVFVALFLMIALMVTGIDNEFMDLVSSVAQNANIQAIEQITDFVNQRFLPLSLAITFVYFSLEIFFAQTLGKMLLGIIIGGENKKSASYSQLIVRFLVKEISSIFSLLFLITSLSFCETFSSIATFVITFGCFFALGAKRQAIHDTLSKTAIYFKDELTQFTQNSRN